ncbi:BTB/POZ domain-containing protein Y57A10B.3-like [Pomacea canaliculata]|uniref:BTB/POZ domain-containing protein Y57A10B.3-like n=1 Tax=Pomacea canaliculata TaxID=400727 RepID=UPI000D728C94|nr:BTB/POZ domain-containing protein Y57A10B.3-like [Pomacea canaliculata]
MDRYTLLQRTEEDSDSANDDKEDESDEEKDDVEETEKDSDSDDGENEDDSDEEKDDAEEFSSKNRFEKRDKTSDIILVVEGRKLHVSKSLLMIHSPVFHAMFTGDFKEQNLKEIPLETKKYATMVNLLEQIYPGQGFELMTDNTLEDLLELADEYQVEHVFTNCKIYIEKQVEDLSNVPTTDKTLLYLKIVDQYDKYEQLHSLREQLVRRASRRPVSRLQKSRHYSSLPPTVLKDVFLRRLQKLEKRS